jgi:hypothetical protein
MPDQEQSTAAPVDWTDDGILRAAFLALFEPKDRALLRRAGSILACQVLSGETADNPEIVAHLRAASEDARMLAAFLQEIAEKRHGIEATDQEAALCLQAQRWRRDAADLAEEIEGEVQDVTGKPAGALGREEAAAAGRMLEAMAAVLDEARNLQRLDRDGVLGRSVGRLAETLPVLEDAIEAAIKAATK